MFSFVIDPSLVSEALEAGRTLHVEVHSATRYKVTLGPPMNPPKPQAMALAKRVTG